MEPHDPQRPDMQAEGARPPLELLADAIARGDFHGFGRRTFLRAGLAFGAAATLAACASTPGAGSRASASGARLPDPEWDDVDAPAARRAPVVARRPEPRPAEAPRELEMNPIGEAALPWAKPRALWTSARPDATELNPMLPVSSITIHHDGLDALVTGTSPSEMTMRIELIRVGHRGKGWADIGYHLVIDRAGTLWQGRSIRWQGAHVKYRNEGNVGVLVMGNFEIQRPTAAQIATLERVVRDLRRTYKVPQSKVYTHREWPDAGTLCPGRHLQSRVESLRRAKRFA